jgi:hypothetical protein
MVSVHFTDFRYLSPCFPIFNSILLLNSKDNELIIHHYDEALAVWDVENENQRPTIPQFQMNWDNINIKRIIANDLILKSPRDLARFAGFAIQRIRILVTCNTFS